MKQKKEQQIKEEPEEDDESRFLRRHWLEYHEEHPSPYAVTLGIEIEIRESTVLPKESKEWTEWQKEEFFQERRKKYTKTKAMGVPRGMDKFWEFAHEPVRGYMTLSREVQALIEMGLINKEYHKHPLHLTIGEVTAKGKGGDEAFVLARALEATGFSTTKGRLLRPYLTKAKKYFAWTGKGDAGVKERRSSELQLGTLGVEIRTFQLQSLTGLDRLLRSAFLLGAALRAYQEELRGEPLTQGMEENTRKGLAQVWDSFSREIQKTFEDFGLLKVPLWKWKAPNPNDYERISEFVPFAQLLDEARKDPKSRGAEFVSKIRQLIVGARKEAAEIMYPSKIQQDEGSSEKEVDKE